MTRARLAATAVVLLLVAILSGCRSGPKPLCRVNDQCFVCADEAAVAKCKVDPTRSRCKWTPLSDCEAKR